MLDKSVHDRVLEIADELSRENGVFDIDDIILKLFNIEKLQELPRRYAKSYNVSISSILLTSPDYVIVGKRSRSRKLWSKIK